MSKISWMVLGLMVLPSYAFADGTKMHASSFQRFKASDLDTNPVAEADYQMGAKATGSTIKASDHDTNPAVEAADVINSKAKGTGFRASDLDTNPAAEADYEMGAKSNGLKFSALQTVFGWGKKLQSRAYSSFGPMAVSDNKIKSLSSSISDGGVSASTLGSSGLAH